MSIERGVNESLQTPDKFEDPGVDIQLDVQDQVVRPDATDASTTVTLPPVAEAVGKIYSIILAATAGGHTCTVADRDDSEYWPGDIAMNTVGDRILAYSDGRCWLTFFGEQNYPS